MVFRIDLSVKRKNHECGYPHEIGLTKPQAEKTDLESQFYSNHHNQKYLTIAAETILFVKERYRLRSTKYVDQTSV